MFAWLCRSFRQRRRTTAVRRRFLSFEALEERCQPALVTPAFGQLPLSFELNRGQADSSIDFLSRGPGYSLGLSSSGAVLDLHALDTPAALLRMSFPGANSAAQAAGLESLAGKSNYFLGSDPSQWITDIATFGKVKYTGLYPGVDLVYYGNQQQLEFDFVVAPGADPSVIALSFQGADSMTLDSKGNLVLHTPGGDVIENAPVLYQAFKGARQPVLGRFVLEGDNQVGFAVGAYDPSRPLIIDPVLAYASYLGGNTSDEVTSAAVDGAGNIYLGGRTDSDSFPLGNPVQNPLVHGFVAKMDPSGASLIYSAYVGAGTGGVRGIAIDGSGNAYATGFTATTSGFATAGAAQTTYGGNGDAFALKLNAAGNALVYATYIGGEQLDEAHGIAADSAGNAYVTGFTTSTMFPTHNALQSALHANSGEDAFVTKINPTGTQFSFSTYLGGNQNGPNENGATFSIGNAITLDAAANVYLTGVTEAADFPTVNAFQSTKGFAQQAFVTELKSDGSQILYSTFLGGPGLSAGSGDSLDIGNGIAVDAAGNILVTGDTTSQHFPVKNALRKHLGGLDDPFVTKLNPHNAPASQLVYSTYLGGSAIDIGYGITVDSAGNAYVTGFTNSHLNFPLVNPIRARFPGGGFMAKLTPGGTVVFNSYFGGGAEKGEAVAVDGFGNAVFVGNEFSTFLPTTPDAFQHDFPDATDSGFVVILRGGNKSYSGQDQDGDLVFVRLVGPGTVSVVRDDPDGDGKGPIKSIFLRGTKPGLSVLKVAVTQVGDGLVDIGSIQGPGLLRISASHADLVGNGISLTGKLGGLRIHDIKNGADVTAAALATHSTSIRAHDIGDGTTINTGGMISLLSASDVGISVIQAPKLATLTVAGDFGANVTLTGTGYAISTATIGGTVSNADFEIQAGSVDIFRAGAFVNSILFIGVGGNLTPGLKVNNFQATGFTGLVGEAFANSTVAASIVGKVTLASVDTSNGNVKFGVHGHERIGSVRVTNPAFVFDPNQPTPQGIGDFEVKLV